MVAGVGKALVAAADAAVLALIDFSSTASHRHCTATF